MAVEAAWPIAALVALCLALWLLDACLTGPDAPRAEPMVLWEPDDE